MYSNAFSYPKSMLWFRRSQNSYCFLFRKSCPVPYYIPHHQLLPSDITATLTLSSSLEQLPCIRLRSLHGLLILNKPMWAVVVIAFWHSKIVPFYFEGGVANLGLVLIISLWPAWCISDFNFQNWLCSLILEASNLLSRSVQSN